MLAVLGEYREGPAFWLLCAAAAYFVVLALRLSVADIRHHRLPNALVLPAYPVAGLLLAGAALAAGEPERLAGAGGGAALLWSAYFLLRLLNPAGMGFGDVKLAGVLGLYLGFAGWLHLLVGTAAAFVAGGAWGLMLIISRRGTGKTAVPFGPFMLAGAAVALVLPVLE